MAFVAGSEIDQQANGAERLPGPGDEQAQRIPDPRVHAVRPDHEIRGEGRAVFHVDDARALRGQHVGSEPELHAGANGRVQDRGVERLPRHRHHACADLRTEHLSSEQPVPRIAHLIVRGLVRCRQRFLAGPDRIQDPQAVLPHEDAGAEGSQLCRALVQPDGPASLRQCRGRNEAGEPASDDFGVSAHSHGQSE